MAQRGLNDAEIASRLGTTERYVIRLKNTDVEPLPDYDFSWFGEDDETIELWKVLPDSDNHRGP